MKNEKVYVRPKQGLLIRDEQSLKHIPPDGAYVRVTPLVRRHLRAGDLSIVALPETSTSDSPSDEG